jgi:CubicO group peptidase (beta-lactamase class C family)
MPVPLWLSASCLLVIVLALPDPVQPQCDYSRLPPRVADVARLAHERVTKGELPSIAIAVAQHGKIVCEEAFGMADREKQIPATAKTIYAAGSVAKSVTGAAIYRLASAGKLRLDDSPERHGVHVRTYDGLGISIRQLLSMNAGIEHGWFYNYGVAVDTKELLQRYAISAFAPGQHFIYSNFSYGILGAVVERAGRQTFSEFVREQLFSPLHMASSGFNLNGQKVATGYQAGKAVPHHTFEPEAGGGFYTSVHDLAIFGLFQLDSGQKLIAPEMVKEMHTLENQQQRKSRYTSGWGVFHFKDGSSALLSNGRVLAGSATLLLLPKAGVAIACLTNKASEATDDMAFQLGDAFSSGLLNNFYSLRKEIESSQEPQPFHTEESQRGSWIGTAITPNEKLPVQLRIVGDDQMEIKVGNSVAIPVEHLGVHQGFVSGEAALRISLPETDGQPSEIELNLRVDRNHLVGTMRTESLGDLPHFGLPVYVSLSKN